MLRGKSICFFQSPDLFSLFLIGGMMDIGEQVIPEIEGFEDVFESLKKNKISTITDLNQFSKSQKLIDEFAENNNMVKQRVEQYIKDANESYEAEMKTLDYQTRKDMIDLLKHETRIKAIINTVFSVLLFITGGYFIVQFILFGAQSIVDSAIHIAGSGTDNVFQTSQFWQIIVYFVYLLVGFAFIQYAITRLQQRMIVKNFSGLSQIQFEIISGLGETRPLVQVIQSTLGNAAKTFAQSLIIGRAMFWTGLAFVVIALYQILVNGYVQYNNLVVGGMGILTWLVSTFLTQRKEIQENLNNVTQLEFILVGLAKKFTAVDLYVSKESKINDTLFHSSLKAIDENVSKSLAWLELYTKSMKEDDALFSEIIKKELKRD
jgi:polyhydroxyalkanoate synthesis regulator phasin